MLAAAFCSMIASALSIPRAPAQEPALTQEESAPTKIEDALIVLGEHCGGRARILARLDEDRGSLGTELQRTLHILVIQSSDGATLMVTSNSGIQTRVFRDEGAEHCEARVSSLVLVLSEYVKQIDGWTDPAAVPKSGPQPRGIAKVPGSPPVASVRVDSSPPAPSLPPRPEPAWSVGVHAWALTGMLPRTSPALSVGLHVRPGPAFRLPLPDWFELALVGFVTASQSIAVEPAPREVGVWLLGAKLQGCVARGVSGLKIRLCLGAAAGGLLAEGRGFVEATSGAASWAALVGGGDVQLDLWRFSGGAVGVSATLDGLGVLKSANLVHVVIGQGSQPIDALPATGVAFGLGPIVRF